MDLSVYQPSKVASCIIILSARSGPREATSGHPTVRGAVRSRVPVKRIKPLAAWQLCRKLWRMATRHLSRFLGWGQKISVGLEEMRMANHYQYLYPHATSSKAHVNSDELQEGTLGDRCHLGLRVLSCRRPRKYCVRPGFDVADRSLNA